jgi:WD40 repeat protein
MESKRDLLPTKLTGHGQCVNGVSFFPGNSLKLITSSDDETMRVWDGRMGQYLKTLNQPEPSYQLHVTPDGKSVVCANGRLFAQKWDIETGQNLLRTL